MAEMLHNLSERLHRPFKSVNQTPSWRRYLKYHSEESVEGIGVLGGISLAVNILMGAGFLSLPLLISKSGILLGPTVMLFAFFVLRTTGLYEAELMCRAEAIVKNELQGNSSLNDVELDEAPIAANYFTMQQNEEEMKINQHAFSMAEICEIFVGKWLQKIYIALLMFFYFCSLVGFTIVFSNALSNYVPIPFIYEGQTCKVSLEAPGCSDLKKFYTIFFGIIVIPLSTIGVKEQINFQMLMTCLRLLVVILMSGTCVYAISSGAEIFGPSFVGDHFPKYFSFSQVYQIIPVSLFTQTINSFVTLVVRDLKEKKTLGRVISTGMFITVAFYIMIGCSVAYYFGTSVSASANVMWEYFTGGYSSQDLPLWVHFISFFVILFPAMDTMSVFPLCAITMASNAMAVYYHDRIDKAEKDKYIVRFFRLLCSVSPFLCSFFLSNGFDAILMYGGMSAIPISLIIPPYLNYISQKVVKKRLGYRTANTPFTGICSHPVILTFLGIFGMILFFFIFFINTFLLITSAH